MNKRANFLDVAEYIKFAIIFGFLALFALTLISGVNDVFQSKPNAQIPLEAKEASTNYNSIMPKFFDYLFIIMLLIFVAFSLFAARLIPSSPKFILVGLAFTIGLGLAAKYLENVTDAFLSQAAFAGVVADLIFIPFILNNLVWVTVIYCLLVMGALYTKDDGA